MARTDRTPRNPHARPTVDETMGVTSTAIKDGDVATASSSSPAPDGPTNTEPTSPAPAPSVADPDELRRLIIDITEHVRRHLASAAALAGITSKAALTALANAVAAGDDRARSLLHDPRYR